MNHVLGVSFIYTSEISAKVTKTMGFLRRNLAFVPRHTKEVAYKTLVRPKNQNPNSFLVKRQNDNTSPGDWPRKISP